MNKTNFNDHLDDMMERLMSKNLSPEELELEIKRSKALCEIASKKIEDRKVAVDAIKVVASGEIYQKFIPESLSDLKAIDQR